MGINYIKFKIILLIYRLFVAITTKSLVIVFQLEISASVSLSLGSVVGVFEYTHL